MQFADMCAPVRMNPVVEWSNDEGSQAVVEWQPVQSLEKLFCSWSGSVVPAKSPLWQSIQSVGVFVYPAE